MNILMIDPDIIPEQRVFDSFEKAEFLRILKENRQRRLLLAQKFSAFGANVLLIEPKLSSEDKPPMEFYQSGGITVAKLLVPAKKHEKLVPFKEEFMFSSALSDNSACFGGLFTPDAVICGGTLPFGFSAGAKIAGERNCALVSELSVSSKETLLACGAVSSANPVLTVLKKAARSAIERSDAVLGFFPRAVNCSGFSSGLFPMETPAEKTPESPSSKAVIAHEKLSSFKEGGSFLLCCAVPLEFGFSIDELISVSAAFGKKFSLVFVAGGTKEKHYKRLVAEKGITNVFFAEDIPQDELSFVLSAADGIYLSECGFLKGFAPEQSRFFTAMLSGRPIVASCEHWVDFFRKSGGTIITKPRNKDSIRLGIKALLEMPCADRDILGASNKSFAEKNSFENFAEEYFSLIDNLVKQKENRK